MGIPVRRARTLWRRFVRLECPRQPLAAWSMQATAGVLLMCLLVALVTSWPWLTQPSLQPGFPSPFTARAPRDATVVDSEELELRRSQLVPRSHVQVVDDRASRDLQARLELELRRLKLSITSPQQRLGTQTLSPDEQAWLESLSPTQWTDWTTQVRQVQARMLGQGLVATVADSQLVSAAHLHFEGLPSTGRRLAARLVAESVAGHSNLRTDAALTQRRIEDLVTQQGVPTIAVKRGDLITRQGEAISSQAYDVLDYFGLVSRQPRPLAWLQHVTEALATCGLILLVLRRWRARAEPRQALLVLGMLLVVQAFKLWLGPAASPMALLVPPTLLLAEGLGTVAGLAWLAGASLLWPLPLDALVNVRVLLAATIAAVAAIVASRQRNRVQLLQLAVLLPTAALVLQWLLVQLAGLTGVTGGRLPEASQLLSEALLMGGLVMAGVLLAPLVESSFGLLTRARLLELADLERPLLRRLSCEAPGTFEHTLMIAGLAEEGARAIRADVDLIRTGALYHDVGKLHAPQWFIENQGDGNNPHDSLDDPFRSAEILQAHVDEGLTLARRHRLPRPLADFIPEHQGTLKMGYFFYQARERDPSVPEAAFRYRGPAPRSPETAILMLADGCEAALRSLPPGTSEQEAGAMVRRIIEARRHDGQLASSGLGQADLELLVRAFVRVWKRMRHRRIPYPIPARKAYSA
ncbi:HDIG domain-containing metalloprotein [Synechococcus sp. CS-1328]|uniref:HDIG domain-containing metalloprotein n=1 Tax=Synechococcus sp. CS-1328 TaxID=2847976 RepID=UPI00223BA76E|nr:HDIG domain-containing metalloprotein [Synechococcus sp. CS-1328]MCT0224191.1 HDIG domain-containing protein [Synechococcus sp. CS-1328]